MNLEGNRHTFLIKFGCKHVKSEKNKPILAMVQANYYMSMVFAKYFDLILILANSYTNCLIFSRKVNHLKGNTIK